MRQRLHAMRRDRIGSLELSVPDELLNLLGIRLVLEPLARLADHSVEHQALMIIILAWPKSRSNSELGAQLSLQPLQLWSCS